MLSALTYHLYGGGGGLADRLKGIVSTYSVAKRKGMGFKLFFRDPFPMEDFLEPNVYNWKMQAQDLCNDPSKVDIVILNASRGSAYQIRKQEEYLLHSIKKNKKQKHVYTNAFFCVSHAEFGELFFELFQPSERLQKSIDANLQRIGSEYISVSCRFMDLCGDFNETMPSGRVLSEEARAALFSRIDAEIQKLREGNPSCKILLNSDSVTFLKEYRDKDYIYIAPGEITHVDAANQTYRYEKFEKTFLDFFLIAHAKKIYLIRSEQMYPSGYPALASKLYDVPFESIKI